MFDGYKPFPARRILQGYSHSTRQGSDVNVFWRHYAGDVMSQRRPRQGIPRLLEQTWRVLVHKVKDALDLVKFWTMDMQDMLLSPSVSHPSTAWHLAPC